MSTHSLYQQKFAKRVGHNNSVPKFSHSLDSVRSFQFEIQFHGVPIVSLPNTDQFTLAAKQVGPVGFTVDDIPVDRVNDKVFYPGKPSPEEVTVTFDNLNSDLIMQGLWEWFTSVYDPHYGELYGFKCDRMSILTLGARNKPSNQIDLFGVYPKSFKTAEFNYSTNDFHTLEMTFRYDMMDTFGR